MTEEKKIVEFEEKKFCGHVIRQRMSDGYLNATDMCKVNNKLYADYTRLEQTKEYLDELSKDIKLPISQLVEVRKGGNSKNISRALGYIRGSRFTWQCGLVLNL